MSNTVSFYDVECERDTELSIFCSIDGEDFCIPKSQISDNSEVYKAGTEGELIITEWIAEKKGLV